MNSFKQIDPLELQVRPSYLIGKQWMLISARDHEGRMNTMTAAWGGLGWLWERPVAFVFIRPERFTKRFVDDANTLSLCFLPEKHRKTLRYLGTVSGRDVDKVAESGLTVSDVDGTPVFDESELALICRKLYRQTMEPGCFIDDTVIPAHYKTQGFHDVYVVELEKVLIAQR